MADLILHHYPTSPFSEKMRLILGYKKLAWKSVIIPPIMPKPDVVALTGGYRKTPVLQIGADIYCDTALICDVLEHVAARAVALSRAAARAWRASLAQWADTTLFWAAMAYNLQPQGRGRRVRQGAARSSAKAFGEDRKAMSVQHGAPAPGRRRGGLQVLPAPHRPTCWTTPTSCSARSPAWPTSPATTRCGSRASARRSMAGILQLTPAVIDWMDRMAAIGHGTHGEVRAQPTPSRSAAGLDAGTRC